MTEQYPIPIDVRCPECSALEGQPCIRDGKSIRSAHWERVVLATNARMARHAAQTCSVCGAPWVRVVEHEPAYRRDVPGGTVVSPAISRTVGFRPSCEHEDVPITTACPCLRNPPPKVCATIPDPMMPIFMPAS